MSLTIPPLPTPNSPDYGNKLRQALNALFRALTQQVNKVTFDLQSQIDSIAVNSNSGNDNNASAIVSPAVPNDGTALSATMEADGSADITLIWSWAGDEADIDGFIVYTYQSATSGAYNFGTNTTGESVAWAAPNKRSFTLYGVTPNKYYTFGVKAYRRVIPSIAANGLILSTLAKTGYSGQNPFQPASAPNFTGNIDGTAASAVVQTAADAYNQLVSISSDNILSPVEKMTVIQDVNVINAEQSGIDAQASAFSVSHVAYDNAISALNSYLATLTTPYLWSNISGDTNINGATFRSKFYDVFVNRQILLNSIYGAAKAIADAAQSSANTASALYTALGALAHLNQINTVDVVAGAISNRVGFYNGSSVNCQAPAGSGVQPTVYTWIAGAAAPVVDAATVRIVTISFQSFYSVAGDFDGSAHGTRPYNTYVKFTKNGTPFKEYQFFPSYQPAGETIFDLITLAVWIPLAANESATIDAYIGIPYNYMDNGQPIQVSNTTLYLDTIKR